MQIRVYHAHDKTDVLRLWNETGLIVPGTDYGHDIDTKTAFQPELFFVGTEKGKIIGTIMAGYDGRRGWLNCLAVHPDLQRKGFGTQLVAYGIERLRELGCSKVNIQVRTSNQGVLAFYEKLGFTQDHVIGLGKRL